MAVHVGRKALAREVTEVERTYKERSYFFGLIKVRECVMQNDIANDVVVEVKKLPRFLILKHGKNTYTFDPSKRPPDRL